MPQTERLRPSDYQQSEVLTTRPVLIAKYFS